MKLIEVVTPKKRSVDWNIRSDQDQIAMINRSGKYAMINGLGMYGVDAIRKIDNPSPKVQIFVVTKNPFAILSIKNPTSEAVSSVLTNERFINSIDVYNKFVKQFFKNNTVLMNKWLRYAENIRELNQ
jgi:hypothetical protein